WTRVTIFSYPRDASDGWPSKRPGRWEGSIGENEATNRDTRTRRHVARGLPTRRCGAACRWGRDRKDYPCNPTPRERGNTIRRERNLRDLRTTTQSDLQGQPEPRMGHTQARG